MKPPKYTDPLDLHAIHVFGYCTRDSADPEILIDDAKDANMQTEAWPTVAYAGIGPADIHRAMVSTVTEIGDELIGYIGYSGAPESRSDRAYLRKLERARWKPQKWENLHSREWHLTGAKRDGEVLYAVMVERIVNSGGA